MYKIGYIDDEPKQFTNFQRKLKRKFKDVELILIDGCKTKSEFVDKICEEQIDVLLVDYKMAGTFGFNGSTLISYINDQIRDLECFILTAVDQANIKDGLVAKRNVRSKTVFDTEGDTAERIQELETFVAMLKESADVFKTRREQKRADYMELYEKRKKGELSIPEESEYFRLYEVLSSYGIIEKLPKEMLTSKFEKGIDELLEAGEMILKKYNK